MKILHIEDDLIFNQKLRDGLAPFGIEVVSALDAQQALQDLARNPNQYDLIIVDGSPGNMNGDLVVSEIRDLTLTTPVLAQSDAANYIQKMFTAGAIGSIPRDKNLSSYLDFARLEEVLRELVLRYKN